MLNHLQIPPPLQVSKQKRRNSSSSSELSSKFSKKSGLKIGILFTATGKYFDFFDQFFRSIETNFLKGYSKTYFLFTDLDPHQFPSNIKVIKISFLGFPGDTLQRYHRYVSIERMIKKNKIDVVYHLDVDLNAVNVGAGILPEKKRPLIAVNASEVNKENFMDYEETNSDSTAFADVKGRFESYVTGAVQGGFTNQYLKACKEMVKNIDLDEEKGIVAKYHDQSHWNKYFRKHKSKFKLLGQNYCWSEKDLKFCFRISLIKKVFKNYFFDEKYYAKKRNSSNVKIATVFKNHYFYKIGELNMLKKIYFKVEFQISLFTLFLSPSIYDFLKKTKKIFLKT